MVGTADLMDERGDHLQSCEVQFGQFGGVRSFEGTVRTVVCHRDFALVRATLATAGHGAALVVDGGGSLRSALLGDRLASAARENGWSGVVVFGAVRDTAVLAGIELGIKALGVSPARSADRGDGALDVPVSFGGVTFVPGAYLWSDDDGLVLTGPSDGDADV